MPRYGCTLVDMPGTPRSVHKRTLKRWRDNYETRDDKIRAAYSDGMTKLEIHRLTGLSRVTIDRVLKEREEVA